MTMVIAVMMILYLPVAAVYIRFAGRRDRERNFGVQISRSARVGHVSGPDDRQRGEP